jgi:hypothetical protein
MHRTIVNAIRNLHVLSLTYGGIPRRVEPHAYGVNTHGNEVLRCYQAAGSHASDKPHEWDLLLIFKMSALVDTGEHFSGARPGYRRGDKAMLPIYAEL